MHIEVLDLVVWLVNCWPTVFGMKSYSSYSCSREEAKEGNGLTKFNCFFFFFLRQSLHRSCLSLKSQNLSTGTQSSLHHLRPINVQTLRTFAVSAQPPYHWSHQRPWCTFCLPKQQQSSRHSLLFHLKSALRKQLSFSFSAPTIA